MDKTQQFWQNKWINNNTGWDIGYAAPPICDYFDTLVNNEIKILIPGAGNAYEAEYLHKKGFKNVYVLDISSLPLENLIKRVPDFPKQHLLNEDFFNHSGKYDLIIEQTFFIAIEPEMRAEYIKKIDELLIPNGRFAGLLIFDTEPTPSGPPYIDTIDVYKKYFYSLNYLVKKFEISEKSIKPRLGREIFFEMIKIRGN